ncbi:MAG: class I SAM-dependent methyltransferase [Bacteroidota bacterium]
MDKEVIIEYLKLNMPIKDKEFDMIYPTAIRKMSKRHFTEVDVAIKASQLLVKKPKYRVLDIGSGVGKFCFVASAYTDALFTGVDYRKHFIDLCRNLADRYRFQNVNFIYDNIMNIDFTKYDSFYFFNSFLEHTDRTAKLDDTIRLNLENYEKYFSFLKEQFSKMPDGTRIVTYHVDPTQIPDTYSLISHHFDGLLACWEQTNNL